MCGKLAVYLRMCGYDTAYALDSDLEADDAIAETARVEGRTVVTRDRALAERTDGILLTERDIDGQLRELRAAGVELSVSETPRYCGRCNGELVTVAPTAETPEYAPDPAETHCWRCQDCGQYFWKGSHWARMRASLD